LADHLYTGAEYEDQQENGDIARRQYGLLEIARPVGRRSLGKLGHQATKKIMIETRYASIEDQQAEYDEAVHEELLIFQEPGDQQVGVEIVKGDQQQVVQDEEQGEISF